MPHRPPQDIYAKHLLSYRGYPLWFPEPDPQLIEWERTDGLKIGDVGVVSAETGFDVLFNICLPPNHPFHEANGIPRGFQEVKLGHGDIRTTPNMETSGCITSMNIRPPQAQLTGGALDYEFNLPPKSGAVLVLPEGADHHILRNETRFLDYAIQHGAEWYRFARDDRGRIIGCHALYLITGFHKAKSWSVAAYTNATEAGGLPAKFSATRVGEEDIDIRTAYTWRTPHPSERRMGPIGNYGSPNQTVFIRGFKVTLRDWFPWPRHIVVKEDAPNTLSMPARASSFTTGSTWMANIWHWGTNLSTPAAGGNGESTATGGVSRTILSEEVLSAHLELCQVFHPCDIINEYLLQQEPSANIAISHDSNWIALLDKKLLTPDELVREEHLRGAVSAACNVVSQGGVVYLESKSGSEMSVDCSSATEVGGFKPGVLQRILVALAIFSGLRRRVDSSIGQISPGKDKPGSHDFFPTKGRKEHKPASQHTRDSGIDQMV